MPNTKRRRGKVNEPGGLGGPGGRGGRRWSIREVETEGGRRYPRDLERLSARDLAEAVKDAVEHEPPGRFSTYRRAMSIMTGYADTESKRMKPEVRKKLADAKRELRDLFGQPQTSYGQGGAGKGRHKPKAKSRRNP